ncbi:MAG TPA: hypothetical protein VGG16_07930 [Streptosporangiaceae bacterium]|jgi:hypothetical protein
MTNFADQLFDDLMREHGPALSDATAPAAPRRHRARRPVLLAAGAGGLAIAATVGTLVAGGGTPAYAVTKNANGTLTLAVYQKDGIAGANARLRQLGEDNVVVVPVGSGCPSISSLPDPAVPPATANGHISVQTSVSKGGSITVDAQGIPAGDILVVAAEMTTSGTTTSSMGGAKLTSPPAPNCVSMPAVPAPPSGGGSGGGGPVTIGNG